MIFDPTNEIVKLCAEGMGLEGEGKKEEALKLFQKAWDLSATDFEKFTSAHYVARHQKNISDKLKWDQLALSMAIKINDDLVKGILPSLYLNVAKCYEDLKDFESARAHYNLARTFVDYLGDDGYGKMITKGILDGIERVK